jgi:hypothetical protein
MLIEPLAVPIERTRHQPTNHHPGRAILQRITGDWLVARGFGRQRLSAFTRPFPASCIRATTGRCGLVVGGVRYYVFIELTWSLSAYVLPPSRFIRLVGILRQKFDHKFGQIKYSLYVIKVIPLETSFEYESKGIIFVIFNLYFYD